MRNLTGLAIAFGMMAASPAGAQTADRQAGYDWAAENGVTDPSSCGGDSPSFVEGCQAWAAEHADDAPSYEDAAPGPDEGDPSALDPDPNEAPQELYEEPGAAPDPGENAEGGSSSDSDSSE